MKLIKFFFFFNLILVNAFTIDIPSRPLPVIDQVGVLSNKVKVSLMRSLEEVERQTTNEICVFVINSLQGDSIENVSLNIVEKWKLGKKNKDNGVLFLIAYKDRKMRIEVGKGLEGVLTDAQAGRIIRNITPYFRKKDFNTGIILALQSIIKKTGGNFKSDVPINRSKNISNDKVLSTYLFYAIFILIFFLNIFRPSRNLRYRGRGYGANHHSGWGGSSGGSRGGSSFGGGGGFSGGGSSGSW